MKPPIIRPSFAFGVSIAFAGCCLVSRASWAEPLPPSPPPRPSTGSVLIIPPPAVSAPPATAPSPTVQQMPPARPSEPAPLYAPPPGYGYEPPLPPRFVKAKAPDDQTRTRAPELSLWLGARLGWDIPLGAAFRDANDSARAESSILSAGPLVQLDAGVRVARKFVPFVFYAHTFAGEGSATTSPGATNRLGFPVEPSTGYAATVTDAKSDLVGLGVRYLFSPDDWGAAVEISYAYRFTRATFSDGAAYKADAPGLLRLAAGVDVRTGRRFALTPMVVATVGSYADVTVQRPGGSDRNVLGEAMTAGYVGGSLGGSFDLFSKWD